MKKKKNLQNGNKQKGKLTLKREAELLKLFGGWSETRESKTKYIDEWCKIYITFIQENNYQPSNGSEDKEEKQLAKWIGGKRLQYKNKKLSSEEIDTLEDLPKWKWKDDTKSASIPFDERCKQYTKFVISYNEAPKQKGTRKNEKQLSGWIKNTRVAYNNPKPGRSLTLDQISTLEKLPKWRWGKKIKTNTVVNEKQKIVEPSIIPNENVQIQNDDKKEIALKRIEEELSNIKKQENFLKRKREDVINDKIEDNMVDEFCDSYNDSKHSEEHSIWKQQMNERFKKIILKNVPENSNVIYLDGESMGTTKILKDTFYKLYVPNDNFETFQKISKNSRIFICHNSALNALQTHWKDVIFSACYFDACTGTAEVMQKILEAFFLKIPGKSRIVVGYTITKRDTHGQSHLERMYQIKDYLRTKGKILKSRESTHEAVATEFHVIKMK
jgi:hypothetical protein